MFKSEVFAKVVLNKFFTNPTQLHIDIIESQGTSKLTVRTVHEKLYHYKESKE